MKTDNIFLNVLLNSMPDQIAVINAQGMIVYVNQSWKDFGVENGMSETYSWLGVNYLNVCHEGEDDTNEPVAKTTFGILQVVIGKKDSYQAEYPCDSPEKRRWFLLHVSRLRGIPQKLFLISHKDITDRKVAEDKAHLLSMSDALTGLANRRHLDSFMHLEWNRGLRSLRPLSILVIDIDHFKKYNDAFGHIRGDYCLTTISDSIQKSARRPSDLVARFGGEEFVVVLGETTLEEATSFAQTLCKKVAKLAIPHEKNGVVTISIGVSTTIPSRTMDEIALINQADAALYLAKKNGRNRVEIYSEIKSTSN